MVWIHIEFSYIYTVKIYYTSRYFDIIIVSSITYHFIDYCNIRCIWHSSKWNIFLLMHHTYVIRRNVQRKYHGTFKFYYSCTFWFQAVKGICHVRIFGPYVNIQCRIAQQKSIGIIEPKNLYRFNNLSIIVIYIMFYSEKRHLIWNNL